MRKSEKKLKHCLKAENLVCANSGGLLHYEWQMMVIVTRGIPSVEILTQEISAWEKERNEKQATINWLFDVDKARSRMKKRYPKYLTVEKYQTL